MALKAGYYGVKKWVANKLNKMNPGDTFATDAEVAAAVAEEAQKIYADMGILGAVNLNRSENSFIFNKTSARTHTFNIGVPRVNIGDSFRISFDISDVSGFTTKTAGIRLTVNPSESTDVIDLTKNHFERVFTAEAASTSAKGIYIFIATDEAAAATFTLSNMMITPTNIDISYQQPVLTNTELTQNKADITALGTEEGATASRLYHPGEHFYKDGKFCTVIGSADVAAESTWTLNTNYVEGSISELISVEDITSDILSSSLPTGITFGTSSKIYKIGRLIVGNLVINNSGGFSADTQLNIPIKAIYNPSTSINSYCYMADSEWSIVTDMDFGYFYLGANVIGLRKLNSAKTATTAKLSFAYVL